MLCCAQIIQNCFDCMIAFRNVFWNILDLFKKRLDVNSLNFQELVALKYKNLLAEQKLFFQNSHKDIELTNHQEHFENPDYLNILLCDVRDNPNKFANKVALDFGCGCGRNIKTLLDLAKFKRVDGVDISSKSAKYAKSYVENFHGDGKCNTWVMTVRGLKLKTMNMILLCQQSYYNIYRRKKLDIQF